MTDLPLDAPETRPGDLRPRRRWDPVVKTTHWSIVGAIVANALITEEGSGAHVWVGYALAAILALRLLWGFMGPAEARFSAFLPSVRRAVRHVRDIRAGRKEAHASHNPLGALMVYAIWSMLGVIIASGIAMAGAPPVAVPGTAEAPRAVARPAEMGHAGSEDEDEHEHEHEHEEGGRGEGEEGMWGEVHETAVNILYVLILLHIAGVAFETRRSGRQVLLAMLPSRG